MSKYDEAFVKIIQAADKEPPERYVRTLDELIQFLLDEDDASLALSSRDRA